MKVELVSEEIPCIDIKAHLENVPNWKGSEIKLALATSEFALRGVDPTILVAIITGTSTVLGVLITGLLSLIKDRRSGKIVIQDKQGQRIEVPAYTTPEKIDELIEHLKKMQIERIEIKAGDC